MKMTSFANVLCKQVLIQIIQRLISKCSKNIKCFLKIGVMKTVPRFLNISGKCGTNKAIIIIFMFYLKKKVFLSYFYKNRI